MIGDKKGIYHSTLTKFGPAFVTIKSDVRKSKNGGYFIAVEHEGTEQYYNVENEACAASLRGLNGQSVTIKATGARDDAKLEVTGGSAAPQTNENARQGASAPQAGVQQRSQLGNATNRLTQSGQAMLMALERAHTVKTAYELEHKEGAMDADLFKSVAMSLFIDLQREGLISTVKAETPQQPEPRNEPEGDIPW